MATTALSGALMVAFGSASKLLKDYAGSIKASGLGNTRVCTGLLFKHCTETGSEPRPFTHPYAQALITNLAMAALLLFANSTKASQEWSPVGFITPALLNVVSYALMAMAVSSGSGLAGVVLAMCTVVATAAVSASVQGRKLDFRQIAGVACIVAGLVAPHAADRDILAKMPNETVTGVCLAVCSSILRAMALTTEETMLARGAPPLAAAGWQGMWGALVSAVMLVGLHAAPGSQLGSIENSKDALLQVANSNELLTAHVLTGAAGALHAWLGAAVSGKLTATHRVVVDALVPVLLFAVSLYEGWEGFDDVKVCGLLVIVIGWAIYTKVWEESGRGKKGTLRAKAAAFFSGTTEGGFVYEMICVVIICANIACYVISTVQGLPPRVYAAFDHFEGVTLTVFTVEYLLRVWACVEDEGFAMYDKGGRKNNKMTRVAWVLSFYSVVDLCSLLPYYVEEYSHFITRAACGTGSTLDLPAFQFLRLFRLFRIMRLDGKYLEAFTIFDDIYSENKRLLFTSSFVGGAIWVLLSGANWASERHNPAMEGRFDTILKSSYFTLCNLFGEFPMVNERSPMGKFIAVITAGVAVAVFAIPTGIFGNGFQERAEQKKKEDDVVTREEINSGEGPQWAVYSFVKGKSTAGVWYEHAMLVLIILNVSSFIVGSTRWAESNKDVDNVLDLFEKASVGIFTLDYVLRFYSIGLEKEYAGVIGRAKYATSFYSIVDLAAVLPFYVGALTPLANVNTSFIRALRLLRMLKAEAYVEAFTVFDDIMYNNRDVLTVTGFAAMVLWVFFSSVMYLLEKDNPAMISPRGDNYYRSIPAAMWITLLNLCGEVPLCDYTPLGKVVSGIMGVVAVGSFAIPIGILGAGFEDWVSDRYQQGGDDDAAPSHRGEKRPPGLTGDIYWFLTGRTPMGAWYETGMFYLVFASVATQALETVPEFYNAHKSNMDTLELLSVCIFLGDYLLRWSTAQHDPEFRGKSAPNLRYLFSFYSIVDLLTIAPYFAALAFPGGIVDQYDEALRMLRLLRLLKMDKYIPSVTLIDDVFRNNAVPLLVTGFTASVFWVIFATMMWMAEDGDLVVTGDNGITQASRFQDVPTALQYTLILLSGDYPLCDFCFWGQVTCFLMCLFAVSVVSIPSSIIASGFTDVALKERNRRGFVRHVQEAVVRAPMYLNDGSFASELHSLLSPEDNRGVWFDYTNLGLIAANVVSVVLESDAEWRAYLGQEAFDSLELISTVVFTLEYVMRVIAAPHDRRAGYSVRGYFSSFFGTADLVALLPWYLDAVLLYYGRPVDFAVLRVLRLVRILQLEHYTEAFTLIDDVFRQCKDTLVATSFLAVIIWIGAAYLFFIFERGNPNVGGAFDNIPNSLYYTAIFLSGEWGQIDFTLPGKVLCCVLVVAGIGLYSIPVGALFDAFGEVLAEQKEEEDKKKK